MITERCRSCGCTIVMAEQPHRPDCVCCVCLRQQRDELLAACEEISDWYGHAPSKPFPLYAVRLAIRTARGAPAPPDDSRAGDGTTAIDHQAATGTGSDGAESLTTGTES